MTSYQPSHVKVFKTGLFSNRAWSILMTLVREYNLSDCTDPRSTSLFSVHRDSRTAEVFICYDDTRQFVIDDFVMSLKFLAILGHSADLRMPACYRFAETAKAFIWRMTHGLMFKNVSVDAIASYIDLKYLFETDELKVKNEFYPNTVPTDVTDAVSLLYASDVLGFIKQTTFKCSRKELLFLANMLDKRQPASNSNDKIIKDLIGHRMNPFEEIEFNEAKKKLAYIFKDALPRLLAGSKSWMKNATPSIYEAIYKLKADAAKAKCTPTLTGLLNHLMKLRELIVE